MGFDMRWKTVFGGFVVFAALIISGCLYLDIMLAEFVSEKVGFGFLCSERISNFPDLLFSLVCIITAVSWTGRLYQAGKPAKSRMVYFEEHIGLTVPLAFVLKNLLKVLFGRTNTRIWLLHPDLFGFHWFHGGGDFSSFPSGHMAVFTVLMLGIGRYFPRLRSVCAGLLFALALALLVTQYHFFSDIVAGACLGLIVDLLTWRGLTYFRDSKNPAN
ncbi:MAG TPA: phosphatase PAP2 family protein [Deltaproteobacteria bacterium]|jgi:membrane-associated phospholipid phosphatase|nr:phosphatase PAP2 family protein [Deltaproteobacteria bacterium]